MDLSNVLKESSIVDHTWWTEGLSQEGGNFNPSNPEDDDADNNIKNELEIEWGYGDASPDYDESLDKVERNIPEENDTNKVIFFSRDMMNQGYPSHQIDKTLKQKFPQETLRKAKDQLKELFDLDGIIGRIAIDSRGYKNCREAMKRANNSPYKNYIRFVIGCNCGEPYMITTKNKQQDTVVNTDNAMDDFFANDGNINNTKEIPCCPSVRLPLYSSSGLDVVDDYWVNDMMKSLVDTTGLPSGIVERINNKEKGNMRKIQKAFKFLDKQQKEKENKQYRNKVDNSQYQLQEADIEICPDDVSKSIQDLDFNEEKREISLEPERNDVSEVDVNPYNDEDMNEEFPKELEEIEIDPSDEPDEEFQGSYDIELEKEGEKKSDLDVNMESSIEW